MHDIDVSLSMTAEQHLQLQMHLYCGDGLESVAFVLCGRRAGDRRHRLMVREIFPVSNTDCVSRTVSSVHWDTDILDDILERAVELGYSVFKIHSHPGGYSDFSDTDDIADNQLLPAIRDWVELDVPHGSLIMLPDGRILGRYLWAQDDLRQLYSVSVVGPDIRFWCSGDENGDARGFAEAHTQAFGKGTVAQLHRLSVCVIGCSGTGSPVIEQLARLGVGHLLLIDDDRVSERNLNRILYSTARLATAKVYKVDMLKEAIEDMGLGTTVDVLQGSLWEKRCVLAAAQCDIVFGCMDRAGGRYILNRLATYYTQPYFDIGVRLEASRDAGHEGQIDEVCGTVHYLQPGLSSLLSREAILMQDVATEGLQRNDLAAYEQQRDEGYIHGVAEDRPAVISVNMFAASLAINDFLARIHAYRDMPNVDVAYIEFSLASLELFPEPESDKCTVLATKVGLGDCEVLLDMIDLEDTDG